MPSYSAPERARWLGVLANATADEVAAVFHEVFHDMAPSGHTRLRGPETGMIMIEARTGGDGAPFNFSEACLTRCSVRVGNGLVGHAWVLGRDGRHAEQAAVLDALLQDPAMNSRLCVCIDALAENRRGRQRTRAEAAAATRVDFFTVVRGED